MEADVVYWGDCDDASHGILSMLRARLPQVRSVIIDDAAWKHLALPVGIVPLFATLIYRG